LSRRCDPIYLAQITTMSIVAVLTLVVGCGRTAAPPPAIPQIDSSGFLPAVRDAVNAALTEATAKPSDAASSGRLGMVLHAHSQLAAAAQVYHRAEVLETDPRKATEWIYYRGVVLLAAGKAVEAAPVLEKAASASASLPAILKTADAYLAAGNNAKAEQFYRKAVESHPNDPSAHFGLGRVTQNPAEFEKALELFPNYGAAMFALAQHLQRTGKSDQSRDLLARYERHKTTAPPLADPLLDAVSDLNTGPTSLIRKAQNAAAQGDLQTAIRLHRDALQIDPKMVQAHVNLISLYARTSQPDQAAQAYRDAIAINPNLAEAHYNYGVLLYGQPSGLGGAKAAFEKAIAADPAHAMAHHNLGAILQQLGQLSAAEKEFERTLELDPSYRNARFQLGRLYVNAGRNADAITQLQKAALEGDDEMTPTYLYALAAAQARAGNSKAAREQLFAARQKAIARNQSALVDSIDRDLKRLVR
jgi:Tfp pilus assembly protein PilF